MSYSDYAENKINDAICNNVALQVPQLYAQLHTGNPGEACTANPAGNTVRQAVSFSPSSGGTAASDADTVWTNVSTTEVYSHGSLWDAASGGNPWGYGPLQAPKSVNQSDTFTLPSGEITFSSE